ncbi:MAG: hypothetical protein WAK82_05590 [Streptosporangiaceae bacterium]
MLREHRGDGHIAALQVAGLDPCEALVSFAAIGPAPQVTFASRGSGLLALQSTLGIAAVPRPAARL